MSEPTNYHSGTRTAEAKALAVTAAGELRTRCSTDGYDAVVVLGSGWTHASGPFGTPDTELEVTELSGFSAPSATGHSTKVRSLRLGTTRVLVFLGRTHLYETGSPMRVAHAIRTGVAAGAGLVVLTGSAGSLRNDFAEGQPVMVRDHINLTGTSPLAGPDFVDLSEAYSPQLRRRLQHLDGSLTEGVYATTTGPHLQTPAELRMLRMAGADLVGHSFALETIAAAEMGAQVLGLAVVSNDAVGAVLDSFDPARALRVSEQRAPAMGELLARFLQR